jgi:hypothetical protein
MKLVNKKNRKAINRAVKKAVKKHGQTLVAGLLGGLASTIATLAKTDAPGTGGAKSNLGMLAENIQEALSAQTVGKHHGGKHHGGKHDGRKKAAHDARMNHTQAASAPS